MTKAKRTKVIYKALHRKSDAPHVVAVQMLDTYIWFMVFNVTFFIVIWLSKLSNDASIKNEILISYHQLNDIWSTHDRLYDLLLYDFFSDIFKSRRCVISERNWQCIRYQNCADIIDGTTWYIQS